MALSKQVVLPEPKNPVTITILIRSVRPCINFCIQYPETILFLSSPVRRYLQGLLQKLHGVRKAVSSAARTIPVIDLRGAIKQDADKCTPIASMSQN